MVNRWWADWVGLFPGQPLWDPYGASTALAMGLVVLAKLFGLIMNRVRRRPKRHTDLGLEDY